MKHRPYHCLGRKTVRLLPNTCMSIERKSSYYTGELDYNLGDIKHPRAWALRLRLSRWGDGISRYVSRLYISRIPWVYMHDVCLHANTTHTHATCVEIEILQDHVSSGVRGKERRIPRLSRNIPRLFNISKSEHSLIE